MSEPGDCQISPGFFILIPSATDAGQGEKPLPRFALPLTSRNAYRYRETAAKNDIIRTSSSSSSTFQRTHFTGHMTLRCKIVTGFRKSPISL